MKIGETLLSERWAHWVASAIGAFSLLIGLSLSRTGPAQVLELRLLDDRFLARGEQPADENIIVLGIDEASISAFQEQGIVWPWPNRVYAEAIEALDSMGAKVIAFDKFFKVVPMVF